MMALNYRVAKLDARQRTVLDFAWKLTATPNLVDDADRDGLRAVGLTNEDIFDLAETVAFFNLSNRMATATDMMPDRDYHRQTRVGEVGRLPSGSSNGGLERRALQIVVTIGSLVPISAGSAGILLGPRLVGSASIGAGDLDSHFRYLSGLLLAVGIAICFRPSRESETHGARRFRLHDRDRGRGRNWPYSVAVGGMDRHTSMMI